MGEHLLRCVLNPARKGSANAKQAANIAFDFGLLGAGLAGLGNHIWYIQETQYVKLAQVRRILLFSSLPIT